MTESLPETDRISTLENHVRGLIVAVQNLTGVVNILDQYMLLNKKFFDQVKINEPVKPEEKVVVPEIVEPK